MRLIEYVVSRQLKRKDFAEELGISPAYLAALLQGRQPSINLALKIEELTDGEVTKEELLFPDEFER